MNRFVAILSALGIAALIGVSSFVEPRFDAVFDFRTWAISLFLQALCFGGFLAYCGFAALHSTQHLSSPKDRTVWLIFTLGINLFGSCLYYLTVYQTFRKQGQGGLMTFPDPKPRPILDFIVRCCGVIAILSFAGLIFFCGQIFYRTYEAQQHSVVACDYTFARKELRRYYSLHGSYPQQLAELGLPTDPKRGTSQPLTPFDYESDGHHFKLHWNFPKERDVTLEGRDGATVRDDWVAQLKQDRISDQKP